MEKSIRDDEFVSVDNDELFDEEVGDDDDDDDHQEQEGCDVAEDVTNETVEKEQKTKKLKEKRLRRKQFLEKNVTVPLSKNPEKSKLESARLIRIVKPARPDIMVSKAVFELVPRGKMPRKIMIFESSSIFVYGYNMASANLALNLEFGDQAKVMLGKYPERGSSIPSKTVWIGPPHVKPIDSLKNEKFTKWLTKKSLTLPSFLKWVKNQTFFKPYFPLEEDVYAANVVDIVRDNDNVGVGAFLKLKFVYKRTPASSAVEPVFPKGETGYAVLERDDFYMAGFSVGQADLTLLLAANQPILCQIRPKGKNCYKDLVTVLNQRSDLNVGYVAYLGYVGKERPTEPALYPKPTQDLMKLLQQQKLTFKEFEIMRQNRFPPNFVQPGPVQEPFGQPSFQMNRPVMNPDVTQPNTPIIESRPRIADRLGYQNTPANFAANERVHEALEAPFRAPFRQPQQNENVQEHLMLMDNYKHEHPDEIAKWRSPDVFKKAQAPGPSHRSESFEISERQQQRFSNDELATRQATKQPHPLYEAACDIIRVVLDIKSADDPRTKKLLQNQEEVDLALKITAVLTRAVSYRFGETSSANRSEEEDLRLSMTRRKEDRFVDQYSSGRNQPSPTREPRREQELDDFNASLRPAKQRRFLSPVRNEGVEVFKPKSWPAEQVFIRDQELSRRETALRIPNPMIRAQSNLIDSVYQLSPQQKEDLFAKESLMARNRERELDERYRSRDYPKATSSAIDPRDLLNEEYNKLMKKYEKLKSRDPELAAQSRRVASPIRLRESGEHYRRIEEPDIRERSYDRYLRETLSPPITRMHTESRNQDPGFGHFNSFQGMR